VEASGSKLVIPGPVGSAGKQNPVQNQGFRGRAGRDGPPGKQNPGQNQWFLAQVRFLLDRARFSLGHEVAAFALAFAVAFAFAFDLA